MERDGFMPVLSPQKKFSVENGAAFSIRLIAASTSVPMHVPCEMRNHASDSRVNNSSWLTFSKNQKSRTSNPRLNQFHLFNFFNKREPFARASCRMSTAGSNSSTISFPSSVSIASSRVTTPTYPPRSSRTSARCVLLIIS